MASERDGLVSERISGGEGERRGGKIGWVGERRGGKIGWVGERGEEGKVEKWEIFEVKNP